MKRIVRVSELAISYNSTPQKIDVYYTKPALRGNLYVVGPIVEPINELSFKGRQLVRVETDNLIYVLVKE